MKDFSFINIETFNKFQRFLYGHDDLFKNLTSLFDKQKLPNKIIFNGSDGVGKATFIYHLIKMYPLHSKILIYLYLLINLELNYRIMIFIAFKIHIKYKLVKHYLPTKYYNFYGKSTAILKNNNLARYYKLF